MEIKLEQAIRLALQHADEKKIQGLLISMNDPEIDEKMEDFDGGDPETVHTLVSLYADDENNDGTWGEGIEKAFQIKYPTHF